MDYFGSKDVATDNPSSPLLAMWSPENEIERLLESLWRFDLRHLEPFDREADKSLRQLA